MISLASGRERENKKKMLTPTNAGGRCPTD